jgi:acetyl esterase/lipase
MKYALILMLAAAAAAQDPKTILLWPEGAPGAAGQEDRDKPALTLYTLPAGRSTGTGVVVCPGGGYAGLATFHEGRQVAYWWNTQGVAAFVLKYRLGPRYHHPAPLEDAQRAIRYVRAHAAELGVAPDRIGIMGFSAGGHLASTAGTHFDAGNAASGDSIARMSSRPDFMILCYPVISFTTEYMHKGSMRNLLGENPDPKLVELLSNEKQVTADTPPTFLFHTSGDTGVPSENSVLFYMALHAKHVPAEMHIYEKGPHGVGLAPWEPVLSTWPDRLKTWMKVRGLMPESK